MQTGNKKTDCKSTGSNRGAAGKGTCKEGYNHCNKPGHQEDTCWGKSGNEHKRTKKYGGRAMRKRKKRKRNGKFEPRNETDKSRRQEAVISHSPFSLKRSSLRLRNWWWKNNMRERELKLRYESDIGTGLVWVPIVTRLILSRFFIYFYFYELCMRLG